jgi:hypothetical protein
MSVAPYIVLFSLAAVAVVEAVAYVTMKGDLQSSRRAQPE